MSLKFKFIILLTISVLVSSALIAGISVYQLKSLGQEEIVAIEKNMTESKKAELKNYIDLALTSIDKIYDNASANDEEAKEQVKNILRDLRFGSDGYFFVYTFDGVNKVLGQSLSWKRKAYGI